MVLLELASRPVPPRYLNAQSGNSRKQYVTCRLPADVACRVPQRRARNTPSQSLRLTQRACMHAVLLQSTFCAQLILLLPSAPAHQHDRARCSSVTTRRLLLSALSNRLMQPRVRPAVLASAESDWRRGMPLRIRCRVGHAPHAASAAHRWAGP